MSTYVGQLLLGIERVIKMNEIQFPPSMNFL